MDGPDLSICIPTFNRSASVSSLVVRILAGAPGPIEVVVLDNGSSDDTLARLRKIDDLRLRIHFNTTNRGVLYNILHVLERASGRHAVLLLDKDEMDPEAVDAFRRFLVKHPLVSCGYCEYDSARIEQAIIYRQGAEALAHVAYTGHHPTGYFFDMAHLRAIDFIRRFSDFDFVGHFPFDFMFAELGLVGDAAVYHSPLFRPESIQEAAAHKSIGTNAAREDAFFSPIGRLKTAVSFARHIATLPIPVAQQELLVAERFLTGLLAATLGFRHVMASPQLCIHYHIRSRAVGTMELVRLALTFYRRFLIEAIRGDGQGKSARLARFHAHVLALIGRRLRKRWERPTS